MKLHPHLTFDGQCEAAFKFYEKCLGGKIALIMKYGESSTAGQAPPAWRDKIMHATFVLGENEIAGADLTPEQYRKPQGFYVILEMPEPAEADRIFENLAENGTVEMPIQETFWARRFGVVVDRFGIPWEINCGKSA